MALVLDLHDGAALDERAGEVDRLGERAAAVAAEVEDDALDALLLEVGEDLKHVAAAAAGLGLAALHVRVELGQADDAELALGAARVGDLLHLAFGRLLLEFHLVADDLDLADRAAARVGGGEDGQDDLGALLAADLADGLLERQVEDVLGRLVALRDRDDLVADLEATVLRGGAAGDEALDLGGAVLARQQRADAEEGQAHGNVEILGVIGREVVGVGVVGLGEGVEVAVKDERGVVVVQDGLKALVGLEDRLLGLHLQLGLGLGGQVAAGLLGVVPAGGRGRRIGGGGLGDGVGGLWILERHLAGYEAPDVFILDAAAPEVVPLGLIFGPGGLLALPLVLLARGEVEAVGEDLLDAGDAVADALLEDLVDVEGHPQVAALQLVIQLVRVLAELLHIGREEEDVVEVEAVEVDVQRRLGDRVVDGLARQVHARQHGRQLAGDADLALLRREGPGGRIRDGGGGGSEQGTCRDEGQPEAGRGV